MTANKPIRIYINAAEYLELKKQRAFKNDRRKTAQVGEGHGAIVYVLSIVFVAPSRLYLPHTTQDDAPKTATAL